MKKGRDLSDLAFKWETVSEIGKKRPQTTALYRVFVTANKSEMDRLYFLLSTLLSFTKKLFCAQQGVFIFHTVLSCQSGLGIGLYV